MLRFSNPDAAEQVSLVAHGRGAAKPIWVDAVLCCLAFGSLTSLAGGDLWQVALSLLVSVEKDLRSSVITYNSAMRLGRKDVWMYAFEGLQAFCLDSLFGGLVSSQSRTR